VELEKKGGLNKMKFLKNIDWDNPHNRRLLTKKIFATIWIVGMGSVWAYFFGYAIGASTMLVMLLTYMLALKHSKK